MNHELAGIDIYFLIKELKTIEGAKIDKIYQWDDDFILRLYRHGSKHHLRINLPHLLYLTEKDYNGPRHPPEYCMFLRKHIQKGRITKIYQKGLDRVVILDIESKKGEYKLVIELLNPGNVSLCTHDEEVIHPLKRQQFSNREIKSKQTYEYPPSRLNPKEASLDQIKEEIDSSEKIVTELAVKLGLGGRYSEEILHRLNIETDQTVADVDLAAIKQEIDDLLEQDIEPYKSEQGVHPIMLETFEVEETYESFTQALDKNHDLLEVEQEENQNQNSSGGKTRNEKLKTIINAQTNQIKSLKKKIAENQKKAELIYENYQDLATLRKKANELIQEEGLEEAERQLRKLDYVTGFDPKNRRITVELDDE